MCKQLMKGNEAIVKSAILAGCRAFYGYPITPASEIAEAAAEYMPRAGGVFLQAESEVAAVNMLYGGAAAGVRCMTASSGPGISLMQEGISYMAGAELPCVIADITRGGPGLGNIAAEQGDYHQVVKGGGNGNYRTIVLAPYSVQERADLTSLAFELADRYRRRHGHPPGFEADGNRRPRLNQVWNRRRRFSAIEEHKGYIRLVSVRICTNTARPRQLRCLRRTRGDIHYAER